MTYLYCDVCSLLLKAFCLVAATKTEVNHSMTLKPTLVKLFSKALKIISFVSFSQKRWLGEMAFHSYNPKQYQPPGLIIFSAYLWLRNYAEIHPGRGHTEPLQDLNTHTGRDQHYINLMIALKDCWKNINPYFIVSL